MKFNIALLALLISTISIQAQEFIPGTIITTRYDTISDVKIKKLSDAKSTLHLVYIDKLGNEQHPKIENIKSYTRGDEVYNRIYNNGEMILVKQLVAGTNLNLYHRYYSGIQVYYIEKVFDELIKVPSSKSKFKKVLGNFLINYPDIAAKIKSGNLSDINEIVNQCNNHRPVI